jgi:hypothetical protein
MGIAHATGAASAAGYPSTREWEQMIISQSLQ